MTITAQDLVNREVHYCVSFLVSTLAQSAGDHDSSAAGTDLASLAYQAHTMDKSDVFAVVWVDRMVGNLHLIKPTAEAAVSSALSMIEKGAGKIDHVRAIRLTPDDRIVDLLPQH